MQSNIHKKRKKNKKINPVLCFFLNPAKWWNVLLNWVILAAITEANVLLCGLIFDAILNLKTTATTICIFIWVCLVAFVALMTGILGTVRYFLFRERRKKID